MSAFDRKESPLFVKTRDFIVWLFPHTAKFPKQYRHTLTERLENAILEFQRCLGAAALLKDRLALDRAELELWQVRQLVRIAHELGIFPARLLEFAATGLAELGRLLGSWKQRAAEV